MVSRTKRGTRVREAKALSPSGCMESRWQLTFAGRHSIHAHEYPIFQFERSRRLFLPLMIFRRCASVTHTFPARSSLGPVLPIAAVVLSATVEYLSIRCSPSKESAAERCQGKCTLYFFFFSSSSGHGKMYLVPGT